MLCTDIAHEKKIAVLPQICILTRSLQNLTQPNFCKQAYTREYAAHQGKRELVYVIVVPWVSRVYGICTLSVVICIHEGEVQGATYNYTKGTADLTTFAT